MKGLLHSMGNAFLTILVIILVVYGWAFIEMKLLLKPQPELFGYVFYQQTEPDMSPEFELSDVIIVKKDANFQSGDIILYFDSKDSLYKAHYVVSTDGNTVVTKCASCKDNNEPIKMHNVVGKAVGKVLFMGSIIAFFKQKVVLVSIAIAGIFFLVLSQYMEFKPKDKEKEDNSSKEEEKNIANDGTN